jgi:hypothetical protein
MEEWPVRLITSDATAIDARVMASAMRDAADVVTAVYWIVRDEQYLQQDLM